jgi:ribosomal-protein-alanine N-acetyltransferase
VYPAIWKKAGQREMKFIIRRGTGEDAPFIAAMLFEAFYWDPNRERPPLKGGLKDTKILQLLENWGRPGDTSMIAANREGEPIGAVWCRLYTSEEQSYGYIDSKTPEIGIAVFAQYRQLGVAKALLAALVPEARSTGIRRLCLSVEKSNFAVHLYESFGFIKVDDTGGAWTMLLEME